MRERASSSTKPSRGASVSVDIVLLTPRGAELALLLVRTEAPARDRWALPWELVRGDAIDDIAARIAARVAGATPSWLEQIGARGDQKRHPADADISIGYLGLLPVGTLPPVGGDVAWFPVASQPTLPPRQAALVAGAIDLIRMQLDRSPIAFKLLPQTFTLSELQAMYELLLGRPLHKASFRRSLQAAWLVEPTDEWRSEGRGRPAQLFRYAPRRRRANNRGARFDLGVGGQG
jgi:8-oxo-dGTP diphosphatase